MAPLARGNGGQSLVELALTLPVLLLLAALIVTLSLVGVARLATENAASEGARTLALTNDDERASATAMAAASPLHADQLDVQIEPRAKSLRPRGSLVRVAVRYRLALPLAFAGFGEVTVEGIGVRRMEYLDGP
jgi:Na+-transporting methylmalonyl-CoA/oxaloacetate decarboxylase gamma subunit